MPLPIIFFNLIIALSSPLYAAEYKSSESSIKKQLLEIESTSKGRIGIYALNTANNATFGFRENERFPMGCTSKVIGVAAILDKSMVHNDLLSQTINYTKKDLIFWSPITEKNLSTGMTVKQLCAASISYSDNAAMNLLVNQLGGIEQINRYANKLGNLTFRQDNGWPKEAYSGGKNNIKDSSTPKDMATSLQKLIFTSALAEPQKTLLISWLKANTTGQFRIKAGLPNNWTVADKTGTGAAFGTTNDLAIIWPPHCAPIILGIYFTSDIDNARIRNDIVASAAKLITDEFAINDSCIRQQIIATSHLK